MSPLPDCQLCPRLVSYRAQLDQENPGYHNQPVLAFGASAAGLLIVGLAPGRHGANASGRPFTGDASGNLLFKTLHRFGFASRADSVAGDDGMKLFDCRITNAVKCVPPKNRPDAAEINRCNPFLQAEISSLRSGALILALGGIAHRAVLKALGQRQSSYRFEFLATHAMPEERELIDSYHCSRYMQQTGKLTEAMFCRVFDYIRRRLDS